MKFYKYQGTGNDFVIVDDRDNTFDSTNVDLVQKLCDRRFGVGGDGLMLLQQAEGYDFRMVYYNADGKEGSMCGNGGRCLVQFAYDQGVIKDETTFIAVDGEHEAILKDGLVHLKMIDVASFDQYNEAYFMDTGSPHHVEFIDGDLSAFPLVKRGEEIRHSQRYAPAGTNVNFVQDLGNNHLSVRTFERGVEDETLSCGTGVTACVLSSYLSNRVVSPVNVDVLGGNLSVSFEEIENTFKNIYLIGPATFVFEGEINC